jgi:hypothetical protein
MLTEDEYMGKTVVILAGYEKEIDEMMASNVGFKSRFSETVRFDDWSIEQCCALVEKEAAAVRPMPFSFGDGSTTSRATALENLRAGFASVRTRPGWANARDAMRAFKDIARARDLRVAAELQASRAAGGGSRCEGAVSVALLACDVVAAMAQFLASRPEEAAPSLKSSAVGMPMRVAHDHGHAHAPSHSHDQSQALRREAGGEERRREEEANVMTDQVKEEGEGDERDVSYLHELAEAKKRATDEAHRRTIEAEERRVREHIEALARIEQERREAEEAARRAADEAERQRLLEEARRLAEEARRLREAEEKERRKMEALRRIGNCPAGYAWHREGGGWRCGGGSHFVSQEQLDRCFSF